jgi:hypothetical protein
MGTPPYRISSRATNSSRSQDAFRYQASGGDLHPLLGPTPRTKGLLKAAVRNAPCRSASRRVRAVANLEETFVNRRWGRLARFRSPGTRKNEPPLSRGIWAHAHSPLCFACTCLFCACAPVSACMWATLRDACSPRLEEESDNRQTCCV